jgi:hypothetical protein
VLIDDNKLADQAESWLRARVVVSSWSKLLSPHRLQIAFPQSSARLLEGRRVLPATSTPVQNTWEQKVFLEEMHQILWYTGQTGICTRGVALTPRSNSPTKSGLREVNKRSPLHYQDRTNTPAGCIATSVWAPCTSLLVLCYFVRLSPTDQLKRPLSRRRNLCHAHCSTERDASHHGIKSSTHVACKTWLKPGNRARQGRQFNLATGIPGVIIYSEPDVRRQGHYHFQ